MNCMRCNGMMVLETVSTRQGKVEMARCLYCGNLVDPVVIRNRSLSRISLNRMLEEEILEEEKKPLQKTGSGLLFRPGEHLNVA